MKKIIFILTVCFLLRLSNAHAQTQTNVEESVNPADTEIVIIETSEIPAVVNKTLSKDFKRPRRQTIYSDHYTHSFIRYDQLKKKTYIYKKNSGFTLELHRPKAKKEKVATVATK